MTNLCKDCLHKEVCCYEDDAVTGCADYLPPIELDCRTCENCTGYSCKLYGADADKAIEACAKNCFKSYKGKSTPQPYKESE